MGVNGCKNGFNYRSVFLNSDYLSNILSIKWVMDSFINHSVFTNFE